MDNANSTKDEADLAPVIPQELSLAASMRYSLYERADSIPMLESRILIINPPFKVH